MVPSGAEWKGVRARRGVRARADCWIGEIVRLTGVGVFDEALFIGEGAVGIGLRSYPGVGIESLPDGDESVDVAIAGISFQKFFREGLSWYSRVMKPENRIESCIRDDTHVSSVADQTMDGIV